MESLKIERSALPEKITTQEEYNAFAAELDAMHDAFAAGDMANYDDERFGLIVDLLQAYKPPKPDRPDAIDAILAYMAEHGLSRADLMPYLGSRARVSDALNRKRPLSLNQMRKLHEGLGLSWDVLAN